MYLLATGGSQKDKALGISPNDPKTVYNKADRSASNLAHVIEVRRLLGWTGRMGGGGRRWPGVDGCWTAKPDAGSSGSCLPPAQLNGLYIPTHHSLSPFLHPPLCER